MAPPPLIALMQRDDNSSTSTSMASSTPTAIVASNTNYNPGTGSRPAQSLNNNIFLILFAVIGALLALASIWFFTMAKHGGFHWREKDWDDYKSTVLRRKGPDGKTLSNATKSTKLGGGSIVPKWAEDESSEVSKNSDQSKSNFSRRVPGGTSRARPTPSAAPADPEFDAYRHEKPAGVGGLNKPAEGSHYDYTNTEPSTVSAPQKMTRKQRKEESRKAKEEQKRSKESKQTRAPPPTSKVQTAATPTHHPQSKYSGVPQDSPSSHSKGYYPTYRPGSTVRAVNDESTPTSAQQQHAHHAYRDSVERGSPQRKSQRPPESHYTAMTDESGHRSYPVSIPGLPKSEVGVNDSISQVGANQHHSATATAALAARRSQAYGNIGYRRG